MGISTFALFAVLEDMEAGWIFNEILKGLTLTLEEVLREITQHSIEIEAG